MGEATEKRYLERRADARMKKTIAFAVVFVVFFVGELFKGYPAVDRITHVSIIAFMATRVFLKSI